MRPEDEPAVHRFLARVTAEDLRLRFFHAMKEFSHSFIARLTQLDWRARWPFVALDPKTGEMMGAVRSSDLLYENGEYAILLQSDSREGTWVGADATPDPLCPVGGLKRCSARCWPRIARC
jgi:acetyltransferase